MLFVYILSFSIFILINILSKGSTFDGIGSDSIKHVNAAKNFKKWNFIPSKMHNFSNEKAWMKDVGVLLLVLFQNILRDFKTFYPVVLSSNFSNFISSILVFVLANNYWGIEAAYLIYFLYLFSIWPKMIVLHGGLQPIAEALFLTSIYLITKSTNSPYLYFLAAGFFFGLTNFTSASSRKYIPLFFVALFIELKKLDNNLFYFPTKLTTIFLIFEIILFIIFIFIKYNLNKIIEYALNNNLKLIKIKNYNLINKEYYIKKFHIFYNNFIFLISSFLILLSISLLLLNKIAFLFFCISLIGFITPFFLLMYPNYIQNFKGYFGYFVSINDWGSHYRLYSNYFQNKYNKIFKSGDEGFMWYIKFYFRILPFHFIIYILVFVFYMYKSAYNNFSNFYFIYYFLMSILPILWSHFTNGPRASLPFYTTYISLFIPIGYFFIDKEFSQNLLELKFNAIILIYILTFLSIIFNIYKYLTDILPSRLTVRNITNCLRKNKIKSIYTIESNFNYPFTDILIEFYSHEFKVIYVKSISEIKSGYLFIPCLNSKASYYQSSIIGHDNSIKIDQNILNLVTQKDKSINLIEKFKTLGSSKYWQHLGDVVSFRDLILNEVNDYDRYIGHAWIFKI